MTGVRLQGARCDACRRMKVKCDGAQPSCGRCIKVGRECPGYSQSPFISMNSASEERARRLRFKRSKKTHGGDGNESERSQSVESSSKRIVPSAVPPPESIPSRLITSEWSDQALCFFLSKYCVPKEPNGMFPAGYLDFLPAMCAQSSRSHVHLHESIAAASLATYAVYTDLSEIMTEARKAYGVSLCSLRTTLSDPAVSTSDETLLTLWLLCKYELISADKNTLWESHIGGQVELIKERGFSIVHTQIGRDLFRMMHGRQQLRDFEQRCMPKVDLVSGIGKQSLYPAGLGFAVVHAFTTATCVAARAQQLFGQTTMPNVDQDALNDDLLSSYDDALEVDHQFQLWIHSAFHVIGYSTLSDKTTAQVPDDHLGDATPSCLHLFRGWHNAVVWCRVWSGRIYILRLLLEHLAIFEARGLTSIDFSVKDTFRQDILEMVDNTCAALPFALGDIDGAGNRIPDEEANLLGPYGILWFLGVIGSVEFTSDVRFQWICRRLRRIGHTCLRQGLVLEKHCISLRNAARLKEAG